MQMHERNPSYCSENSNYLYDLDARGVRRTPRMSLPVQISITTSAWTRGGDRQRRSTNRLLGSLVTDTLKPRGEKRSVLHRGRRSFCFNPAKNSRNVSVCGSLISRTVHLVGFTLGRCVGKGPRKSCVEFGAVWT